MPMGGGMPGGNMPGMGMTKPGLGGKPPVRPHSITAAVRVRGVFSVPGCDIMFCASCSSQFM